MGKDDRGGMREKQQEETGIGNIRAMGTCDRSARISCVLRTYLVNRPITGRDFGILFRSFYYWVIQVLLVSVVVATAPCLITC